MIKFFRKVRQQLIKDNKLSKYLFYAIGEIVLVVIGILIALSINNWNEKRKDLAKEQLILKQLKNEYLFNLEELEEKILMRNEGIEASNIILNQIDNPEQFNEDLLYKSFWKILSDPTFDPIQNDIVASDKIRLIRNQAIVKILSNWSSEVFQVQELEREYQKYRTESIMACVSRLGITRNIHNNLWKDGYTPIEALDKKYNYKFTIKPTKKNINFEEVLSDVELEGIVSMVITVNQLTNMQSESLRQRIINLLEMIDNEIAP